MLRRRKSGTGCATFWGVLWGCISEGRILFVYSPCLTLVTDAENTFNTTPDTRRRLSVVLSPVIDVDV